MGSSFSPPPPSYQYALGPDHHAPSAFFEPPQRKKITINLFTMVLKFALSIGLLAALVVGYILGFKIIRIGGIAVGLYGVILIVDFCVQLTCALANRVSVDRIVAARLAVMSEQNNVFADKRVMEPNQRTLLYPDASISIAVVGYREDDDAWRLCLRSIQKQSMRPRQVICVVDGNEGPDLKMANSFAEEFAGQNTALIHLPIRLSSLHKDVYHASLERQGFKKPGFFLKVGRWLNGSYSPQQEIAIAEAREAVIQQVEAWEREFNISSYDSVCFSQPHGHKRTAMFTAFCVAMYATRTRDAIFTTDSDTLLQEDALDEMFAILDSDPQIGGVTADVKIFNRAESWLARFCSIRYWFAFNIERACQSFWRCVGCISGPMGLYRAYDMDAILGKWNLQTFAGKETTFGDDRHLTNQLLAHGLKTRYTHRTWCESESPTSFVRWIKQQTRWSKSFFREAFWFPKSFLYQQWWMTVETTKQALYPFILISTITLFMYKSDSVWRPLAWLTTMIGVAFIKSVVGAIIAADLWMVAFTGYCVIYFFGLLPSKIYALFTMAQTTWGTSARSATEIRKGESFRERTFHIGFLVLWYTYLSTGMAFFTYRCLIPHPLALCIAPAGLIPGVLLYAELIFSRVKYAMEDKSNAGPGNVKISNPMPVPRDYNVLRKHYRPQRPDDLPPSNSGFTSVDLASTDNVAKYGPYSPTMTESEFGDIQPSGHIAIPSGSGATTLTNGSAVEIHHNKQYSAPIEQASSKLVNVYLDHQEQEAMHNEEHDQQQQQRRSMYQQAQVQQESYKPAQVHVQEEYPMAQYRPSHESTRSPRRDSQLLKQQRQSQHFPEQQRLTPQKQQLYQQFPMVPHGLQQHQLQLQEQYMQQQQQQQQQKQYDQQLQQSQQQEQQQQQQQRLYRQAQAQAQMNGYVPQFDITVASYPAAPPMARVV
ncbi:hypothetical protein V8E36_008510 [Tilletia maclaganii]